MQNRTKKKGHEIKSFVVDMRAKWAIFVLNGVSVWGLGYF